VLVQWDCNRYNVTTVRKKWFLACLCIARQHPGAANQLNFTAARDGADSGTISIRPVLIDRPSASLMWPGWGSRDVMTRSDAHIDYMRNNYYYYQTAFNTVRTCERSKRGTDLPPAGTLK